MYDHFKTMSKIATLITESDFRELLEELDIVENVCKMVFSGGVRWIVCGSRHRLSPFQISSWSMQFLCGS